MCLNEEFRPNMCFKHIYLEDHLQATLSELCSLQLAINLLYSESTIYSKGEVRLHPVLASSKGSLPSTLCTVQPKCIRMGSIAGRTEILKSTEREMALYRFAVFSNLFDYA